jgi:hypothetical protein
MQHQTERIDQDMALLALDQLARVITAGRSTPPSHGVTAVKGF